MKQLEIYNVAAQEGSLLAVILYSLKDYKDMYQASNEDYKDYLLERHKSIEQIKSSQLVQVVDVPFEYSEYLAWLQDNESFEDTPAARSAWALYAAKNPEVMARLNRKNPILPKAPIDENLESVVLFGSIFFSLTSKDAISALSEKLSKQHLLNIMIEFNKFFSMVSDLQKLSSIRYRGIRLYIGDRLITPESIDVVEEYMNDKCFEHLLNQKRIIPIPSQFCINHSYLPLDLGCNREGKVKVEICPLMLPMGIIGARGDLEYCYTCLKRKSNEVEGIEKSIRTLFNKYDGCNIEGSVFFDDAYETDLYLQESKGVCKELYNAIQQDPFRY